MSGDQNDILDVRVSENCLKFTINPTKCPVKSCTYIIRGSGRIPHHLAEVHNLGQDNVRYFCPFSGCKYNGEDELMRHFTSPKLLKQHYCKVHAEKIYQCEKCGVGFGMGNLRNYHQITCGVIFKCGECNCKFNSLMTLTTHCQTKGHKLPDSFTERNFKNNSLEERPLEMKEIPMEACSFSPALNDDHSYTSGAKITNGTRQNVIFNTEVETLLTDTVSQSELLSQADLSKTIVITRKEDESPETVSSKNCNGVSIDKSDPSISSLPTVRNIPALVMVNVTDKIPSELDVQSLAQKQILPKPFVTIFPIGQNVSGTQQSDVATVTSCDAQTETSDVFGGDLVSAGSQTSISTYRGQNKEQNMVTGGTQTTGDLILRKAMESADLPVQMESVGTQISDQLSGIKTKRRNLCTSETQTNSPSSAKRRKKCLSASVSEQIAESPRSVCRNYGSTASFIPIIPTMPPSNEGLLSQTSGMITDKRIRIHPKMPITRRDDRNEDASSSRETSATSETQNLYGNVSCDQNETPGSSMVSDSDLGTVLSIPDSVIDKRSRNTRDPELPESNQICNDTSSPINTPSSANTEAESLLHSDGLSQILNQSHDMAIQTFDEDFRKFLYESTGNFQVSTSTQINNDYILRLSDSAEDVVNTQTQTMSLSKDSSMQTQKFAQEDFLTNTQTQTRTSEDQLSSSMETQTMNSSELTSSHTQTSLRLDEQNREESSILADASTSMENVFANIQTQTVSDEFLTNMQTQTVSDFDVLDLFMNSIETQTHSDSFLDEFSFTHNETQTYTSINSFSDLRNMSTSTQTTGKIPQSHGIEASEFSLASIQTQTTNQHQDNLSISTQTLSDFPFDFPLAGLETSSANDSLTAGNASTQTNLSGSTLCNFSQSTEGTQTVIGMDHITDVNSLSMEARTNTENDVTHSYTQTTLGTLDNYLSGLED